ncbi:hypothetical protein BDV59DRAFT_211825 [Aspergillus ambiguus]|uniref:uncharacterized protein n=1 Tax=Aspergillus ambiguus TaxID=176160 RepID=UPI003CCCF824
MPPTAQTPKRATGACQNCRRRKVKCSGTQPCTSCQRLGKECIFHEDRRISVSRREFHALKRKIQQLEPREGEHLDTQPSRTERGVDAFWDRNPLASPSSFVHRVGARQRAWFFQGPTSSWSFTHRVLHRIAVCFGETLTLPLVTDGDAYQLPWQETRSGEIPDVSDLPSHEHALYLMSTVKYHLGDIIQLFEDEEFVSHLHELYEDVHLKVQISRLWYIQYLVILALGEAFLSPSCRIDGNPVGCQYFTRAMSILPDLTKVWDDPILAIEVLAAVALYLYSVDMRDSSSCYVSTLIGQAMRIALIEGLHRALPGDVDSRLADRCTRIWWTVYILENKITASEGVPSAIRDEDITAILWDPQNCSLSAAGLTLHVKVTQAMARVLRSVYRPEEGQQSPFLRKVQSCLRHMASLSREWEQVTQMRFKNSVDAVSGISTRLNLSYHLCVIITIRPLIFSLLLERLDCAVKRIPPRQLSPTVQALVQACVDAAAKSLKILGKLHEKNLLEAFLPFDLEYTFAAAFALRLVSTIVPREMVQVPCTEVVREILHDLIGKGNRIALFRQAELDELDRMLSNLRDTVRLSTNSFTPDPPTRNGSHKEQAIDDLDAALDRGGSVGSDWGSHGEGMGLLSDQILSVVNQLAVDDIFVDNSIVNLGENRRFWDTG